LFDKKLDVVNLVNGDRSKSCVQSREDSIAEASVLFLGFKAISALKTRVAAVVEYGKLRGMEEV